MKYVITGSIKLGRMNQSFTKSVEAKTETLAKELLCSDFGGKYKVDRGKIKITEIKKEETKNG